MSYRYGLLRSPSLNIGDDIQSVAVRPFLPNVDLYVDARYLREVVSAQKVKLIIHGCFDRGSNVWPPSLDIKPLLISLHIGGYAHHRFTSDESIRYFKKYEPVGCRDYPTRDLLMGRGVDAYFSGCVTLMMGRKLTERTDEIILADLDEGAIQYIPPYLLARATVLHHGRGLSTGSIGSRIYMYSPFLYKAIRATKVHIALDRLQQKFVILKDNEERRAWRFQETEDLLTRYAQAKLVITSRFHCALPCLAFGTPVIFVHRDLKDTRFPGLLDYIRAYTIEEFKYNVWGIDVNNPEPNPRSINELRNNLIQTCQEFIGKGGEG